MKTVKRDDGFIGFVISAVYVDDIIPVSNDVKMLKAENLKWLVWEKFTSSLECQSRETELLGR